MPERITCPSGGWAGPVRRCTCPRPREDLTQAHRRRYLSVLRRAASPTLSGGAPGPNVRRQRRRRTGDGARLYSERRRVIVRVGPELPGIIIPAGPRIGRRSGPWMTAILRTAVRTTGSGPRLMIARFVPAVRFSRSPALTRTCSASAFVQVLLSSAVVRTRRTEDAEHLTGSGAFDDALGGTDLGNDAVRELPPLHVPGTGTEPEGPLGLHQVMRPTQGVQVLQVGPAAGCRIRMIERDRVVGVAGLGTPRAPGCGAPGPLLVHRHPDALGDRVGPGGLVADDTGDRIGEDPVERRAAGSESPGHLHRHGSAVGPVPWQVGVSGEGEERDRDDDGRLAAQPFLIRRASDDDTAQVVWRPLRFRDRSCISRQCDSDMLGRGTCGAEKRFSEVAAIPQPGIGSRTGASRRGSRSSPIGRIRRRTCFRVRRRAGGGIGSRVGSGSRVGGGSRVGIST